MPRHDNFIPVSNSPTWRLTDAWIPVGGEWLYLEFTANSTQTAILWREAASSLILNATNGNVTATYQAVSYHTRGTGSVVTASYKLSRKVSRDELVNLQSTGSATILRTVTGSNLAGLSVTNPYVRNYGNVDASGNPSLPLRSGNTTNNISKRVYAYPDALVDGIQLRGRDIFSNGVLTQGNETLEVRNGSIGKIPNDFRFGSKDSVLLSNGFIGRMRVAGLDYQWQPQTQYRGGAFTIYMEPGSTFSLSAVQDDSDANGGDGNTPGNEPGGGDIIVQPIDDLGNEDVPNPDGPPPSGGFSVFDLITVSTITNTMTIAIPGTQLVTVPLGKIERRAITFGFRWNQSAFSVDCIGPNGHIIKTFDGDLTPDFPVAQDYLGIRTNSGEVYLAEIALFNTGQNWSNNSFVKDFVAMLDGEYATPARAVYVDFDQGSDALNGEIPSRAVKTLEKALTQVAVASGDHILCKTGTVTPQRSTPFSLGIAEGVPLGYSPDYPFVLGYYDGRVKGRVTTDFSVGATSFLEVDCLDANIAIHGHKFTSKERNSNDPLFVGYVAMRGNANIEGGQGFGVVYDQPLKPNSISGSVQVIDSEIANASRHSVCLRTYNPDGFESDPEQFKYSGLYRTLIHNSWNPYAVDSQNQEPVRSGSGPSQPQTYGIAGLYAEGVSGIHCDEVLFYRVGWQPEVVVAGISNARVSSSSRGSIFKTTNAPATSGMNDLPPSWIFANNDDPLISNNTDDQRVHIVSRNGSPVSIYATVYRIVDTPVNPPTRIEFKESRSALGLGSLDLVDAYLLDGGARTSGNMDLVFMGNDAVGSTSNQTVTNRCLGLFGLINTMHIESSGYIVTSRPSYFAHGMVSENNLYGLCLSPDYTHVRQSFFGGSVGTDYARRHSNSTYSGVSQFPDPTDAPVKVGNVTVDHGFSKHAWVLRTPFNGTTKKSVIDHTIISYLSDTNLAGSVDYNENDNRYPSAAFYFGPQPGPGLTGQIDVRYCTVHGMPGSAFNIAFPGSLTQLNLSRLLVDQPEGFADTANYAYAFDFPYRSTDAAGIGSSTAVNFTEFNLYNQNNAGVSSGANAFARISNTQDASFTGWVSRADTGNAPWADVTFATAGASIPTYSVDVLGGPNSAVEFASNAIGAHANGWDSDYSTSSVLTYLRSCFEPTNLNAEDYGDDYLGAVEFGFGTPPTDPPFAAQLAAAGTFFNYGRGF